MDPRGEEIVESVPTVSHGYAAETLEMVEAAAAHAADTEMREIQGELDFGGAEAALAEQARDAERGVEPGPAPSEERAGAS